MQEHTKKKLCSHWWYYTPQYRTVWMFYNKSINATKSCVCMQDFPCCFVWIQTKNKSEERFFFFIIYINCLFWTLLCELNVFVVRWAFTPVRNEYSIRWKVLIDHVFANILFFLYIFANHSNDFGLVKLNWMELWKDFEFLLLISLFVFFYNALKFVHFSYFLLDLCWDILYDQRNAMQHFVQIWSRNGYKDVKTNYEYKKKRGKRMINDPRKDCSTHKT